MNEFELMAELKDKAVLAERLANDNTILRNRLSAVEWCSHENTCPECGFHKPKHNPGGCKLNNVLHPIS